MTPQILPCGRASIPLQMLTPGVPADGRRPPAVRVDVAAAAERGQVVGRIVAALVDGPPMVDFQRPSPAARRTAPAVAVQDLPAQRQPGPHPGPAHAIRELTIPAACSPLARPRSPSATASTAAASASIRALWRLRSSFGLPAAS